MEITCLQYFHVKAFKALGGDNSKKLDLNQKFHMIQYFQLQAVDVPFSFENKISVVAHSECWMNVKT